MGFAAPITAKPAAPMQPAQGARAEPFEDVEQAWFWTIRALRARHDVASSSGGSVARPCDPDDIIRCLDRLYRNRRIDLAHARILRLWGERQVAPGARGPSRHDVALWQEAMDRLDPLLRGKGIIKDIRNNSLTHIDAAA